jgi:hypothetical protein
MAEVTKQRSGELMQKIVLAAMLAAVIPATAAAQWTISEEVDPFTDERRHYASLFSEERQLMAMYSCGRLELLIFKLASAVDTDLFANERVQIRFDDDTAETATWGVFRNESLVPSAGFVQRMAQHQTLLMGVTAFPNDRVVARFNLIGTAAMLEQINCEAE